MIEDPETVRSRGLNIDEGGQMKISKGGQVRLSKPFQGESLVLDLLKFLIPSDNVRVIILLSDPGMIIDLVD